MLQSPAGATIAAMMKATGWQQHSVRGFLAGVVRKRLKLKLGSKKVDGKRVYQIAGAASGKSGLAGPSAGRPERHAARQDRSGDAGPKDNRRRDRAPARSRCRCASGPLAHRVRAATAPSPAPPSPVSRSGLPASGRHLGDLDRESQRLLDRSESPENAGQRAVDLGRRTADLRPGTVLGREWNGQMQRVAVLADGFAWNGKTYPSLSKVAFAITGTRWNGPKFFGLRDKPSKGVLAMKAGSAKPVRCAIYTRVSTDQGLEQDFNSLDAQYDASQAYIRSQAHAGWTLLRAKYDDGGFSGGNTDRPALQRLLEDVRAGKIDIIVVYKVDRLTRSLADFAKLVELFDKHDVSFVSVTQQFNTTTSMGRLTLNVLLSFAQFEREVTSERIRDKIAASKRKGLWVGGMAPLGYDTKDRKITVNEAEAERVRTIFRSYLKLGSLNLLMADLRKRGIVTKLRTLKTGETVGGIPFTRGPLAHLLRNRFYIGEVAFKGEILKGEQPAIVDRELFDAVQAKLTEQVNNHKAARMKSEALVARPHLR